ncbi:hypothetical protein [Hymenobacter sp. YC55]|uniref:hypothetical protein n=1 Tax=Hymenobacter sp. YC55 TaxID=3034019 RepID=UPI0023F7B8CF|nr:hypothetical protein [Hymenobacter sp. YC55]MDF7815144.1 hypothetical protein [Hymenobacter sp. YC55]
MIGVLEKDKTILFRHAFLILLTASQLMGCAVLSTNTECGTEDSREYTMKNKELQLKDNSTKYRMPVVFHVLYNTEAENISKQEIENMLATLSHDFTAKNIDLAEVPTEFKAFVGNPDITFYLANKLPNGEDTDGIIRKKTTNKSFKVRERKAFFQSKIISPKSYLNVYICDIKNSNAYTPTESNLAHDGIVIDYKRVFGGSRTLTHEVGHWLDLRHIF